MIIAQISDPHLGPPGARLFGGYDADAAFSAVLARVAGFDPRPDIVLLTGDLTENGTPEEYANFNRLIEGFDLPMVAIPGNHDRRAAFAAALAPTPIAIGSAPWFHLCVEEWPLRLIGLDSLGGDGESRGVLCAERLDWLAARFSESDRPVLLFLHHQPFATGIPFVDANVCVNGDRLGEIVAGHPRIAGVLCGHVHRAVQRAWAGTIGMICPGVAWEVPLDLSPAGRPRLVPQNPGWQLHVWSPEGGLVSHTEYLPGFE
ncbi:MAG TPA: phosphodiesterase [Amaricoccus sp.]|nr:phosphodiesterase [Paracoccaceae bacterium]MCB1402650.1 phosphodiesterase [Paracoccaceae bacterium]HPG23038.1 phosphodiesterase [Amaricoccus sp.]